MTEKAFLMLDAHEVVGLIVALVVAVLFTMAIVEGESARNMCTRILDALHAANQPQAAAIAQAAGGCPKGEK